MPIVVDWDDAGYAREADSDRYKDVPIEEFWLRFEGKPGSGNQYRIRLLGSAIKFITHYNNKIDPHTGERKRVNFPDAETVSKKKRNCTDEAVTIKGGTSEKCPWCKLGYQVTPRYMVNLAYYGRLDDEGLPTIMMAEVPSSAWEDIRQWRLNNKDNCPEGPGTLAGKAPNFVITVKLKGKKTEYSVQTSSDTVPLPDEVKRAIKKFNPDAKTAADVKLHDLKRFCTPTYMSGLLQIEKFGKIIDQVPYTERKRDEEEAEAEEGTVSGEEFGSTDAVADGDVDSLFGTSDGAEKEDEAEEPETAEDPATAEERATAEGEAPQLPDNPLDVW